MNKSELMESLANAGILFPRSANILQLRKLWSDTCGNTATNVDDEIRSENDFCGFEPDLEINTVENNVDIQSRDAVSRMTIAEIHNENINRHEDDVNSTGNFSTNGNNKDTSNGHGHNGGNRYNQSRNHDDAIQNANCGGHADANNCTMIGDNSNENHQSRDHVRFNSSEECIRLKIRLMENEIELLRLKNASTNTNNQQFYSFIDVENAVQKFSGDHVYRVEKWFEDLEEVFTTIGCNLQFRYLCTRRLLDGTAKMFLRTIKVSNYGDLKNKLIGEFKKNISMREVYDQLRKRCRRLNEPIFTYVLAMQEIAMQGNVEEIDLVHFIVDGLRDSSAHASILYSATTVVELKPLLATYNKMKERNANSQSVMAKKEPIAKRINNSFSTQVRCYNCSKYGHVASQCDQQMRPVGSCFKCGQMGHFGRNCPQSNDKPRNIVHEVKALNSVPGNATNEYQLGIDDNSTGDSMSTVGAANINAETCQEEIIDALQKVGVRFKFSKIKTCCDFKEYLSLLDSGSPASFIRKNLLPFDVYDEELMLSNYEGLSSIPLKTYGNINCLINLKNKVREINFVIVQDETISTPLLLGRDFLEIFNIQLIMDSKLLKNKLNKTYKLDLNVSNIRRTLDNDANLNLMDQAFSRSGNDITLLDQLLTEETFKNMDIVQTKNNVKCCDTVYVDDNNANFLSAIDPSLFIATTKNSYLFNPEDANINSNIDMQSVREIIVKDYLEVYSKNDLSGFEMNIRLTSDTPIYSNARRLSYSEKQKVQDTIEDLLTQNIIRPSNSPYASPIVLVKRKNGDTRLCIDYRNLNKVTARDNFPLPLIEDCLEILEGKQYFTTIDLKNGFHQIKMAPDSIKYTSFVTPNGQYEYMKMPFGLKNAPAVFMRSITSVLQDFIRQNEIVVYIDDILIATKTLSEHLCILRKVLNRLAENGLEINLSKCKFCYEDIEYLGYSVNKFGISPNMTHQKSIRDYPITKTTKQLNSFLGLCAYFRKFIQSFSHIAKPLYDLLRKDKFIFDDDCRNAFETLKEKLSTAPLLSIYNPKRTTELHCDASSHGFGAALMQKQDDAKFHPVAYFSQKATTAEAKYHSFELETLAIIYALRRFRVYLEGISFKIVTDCNSLTLTLNKKTLNPRISRWALELENYNYTIEHRKGTNMGHVDALSRCNQIISVVSEMDLEFQIQAAQSRDSIIVSLRQLLENEPSEQFELREGIVYKKHISGELLLYVPVELENNIIRHIHEKIGHLGISKCVDQIKMHYWFPKIKIKVEEFIRNCIQCILYSAPVRSNEKNLYNIPKQPIPFHTLHLDHYGPLPAINSRRKYILVAVDAFTKYVKLYPVLSTSTKEVIASLNKYFEYYGRPSRIISDRATCFTSLEFRNFLLVNNIDHIKTAVSSPQANGQVERVNRTLTGMLGKLSEPLQHSDWVKMLNQVEYALNNTIHSTTKDTPSMLMFGVYQRGPVIDKLGEFLDERKNKSRNILEIRENASKNIALSQQNNSRQFGKHNVPARTFSVGDFVVIKNIDTTVGTNKKLVPKFRGPYVISKVLPNDRYVVRDVENCQITRLPYDSVIESRNIRKWKTF